MPLFCPVFQSSGWLSVKRRVGVRLLLLLVGLTALSACGKRPVKVDPPSDAGIVVYPRVYPDPATDPKP